MNRLEPRIPQASAVGVCQKLFGHPIMAVYGRLAYSLYRAADIDRKFWLAYLKETDSDPKGIDKHLRRIFKDRRCQWTI